MLLRRCNPNGVMTRLAGTLSTARRLNVIACMQSGVIYTAVRWLADESADKQG